jgi:hypothetical protein
MARKGDGPFRIVLKLPYNFFRVRFYPSGQMPVSPPLGIAAVGEEGGTVSFGDFLSISDESTIFSWSNHFTTGSTVSYGITYKFFRLPVLLPAFNPSLTVSFDAEFFSYDNPSLPFRPHMFIQVGFIYNNYGFLTNMREWPLYDEMNLYNLPFVLRFSSKKDLLGYKYFYEQYSYSDRITVTALCGSFSAVPEIQWAEVRLDNFRIIAEID